jgi:hypothetical protein
MKNLLRHPFFIRLLHWEYWSFHIIYGALYPYWLWLCLKARSFFFFSTSNPGIENGGFLMESKKQIYDLMPPTCYPKTALFKTGTDNDVLNSTVTDQHFTFPIIGKPDKGMRGMAVKKLYNEEDLIVYNKASKVDFLIQEYIPYQYEAGIFYYRFPEDEKGHISGIVAKEFLMIEGDGRATILELLKKEKRYILQLKALTNAYKEQIHAVLAKGERKILVPYGNHSRGAKFIDASERIDAQLTEVIDSVCQKIPGFYYGRMDIKFQSWEDLKAGKNFSIIELNGAGSEPTHMYDPRHSIFFAWREIIRHWNILYQISKQNRSKMAYMNFHAGVKMFRDCFAYVKLINKEQQRA